MFSMLRAVLSATLIAGAGAAIVPAYAEPAYRVSAPSVHDMCAHRLRSA